MASTSAFRALLVVEGARPRSLWARAIEEIARKHPQGKLCILFKDATSPVTRTTLRMVTRSYEAISTVAPRMDLVPLFPAAGWTVTGAGLIEDLTVVAIDRGLRDGIGDADVSAIDHARAAAGLPLLDRMQVGVAPAGDEDESPAAAVNGIHAEGANGTDAAVLAFAAVAVGGTFDRLHAGHRLLLSVAALVCQRTVYLGIAGEALLKNKPNAQLLQSFSEREASAAGFIKQVRPGLGIDTSELLNGPPKASTMREMEALVVSRETMAGATLIQKQRNEAGFNPVEVVVVDLVGAKDQSPTAPKLSSSMLREAEARRLQRTRAAE